MKVIYSEIVIFFLFLLSGLLIHLILKMVRKHKLKRLRFRYIATLLISFTLLLTCIFTVGEYVNPFDQTVNTRLIAVFPIEEEYPSTYPERQFWYSVYKGSSKPDSMFNIEAEIIDDLKKDFMHLDHHSYIITYGQKIEKLTYNVWDTINDTYMTGAKVGNIVFEETFEPQTMYVYEIPRLNIENDLNNTLRSSYIVPPAKHVFWLVSMICVGATVLELTLLSVLKALDKKEDKRGQKGQGGGLREP